LQDASFCWQPSCRHVSDNGRINPRILADCHRRHILRGCQRVLAPQTLLASGGEGSAPPRSASTACETIHIWVSGGALPIMKCHVKPSVHPCFVAHRGRDGTQARARHGGRSRTVRRGYPVNAAEGSSGAPRAWSTGARSAPCPCDQWSPCALHLLPGALPVCGSRNRCGMSPRQARGSALIRIWLAGLCVSCAVLSARATHLVFVAVGCFVGVHSELVVDRPHELPAGAVCRRAFDKPSAYRWISIHTPQLLHRPESVQGSQCGLQGWQIGSPLT
jgi:hypothetical protein